MSKGKVLRAVRRQCVECMGNHATYVKGCTSPACPLFPYRLGTDPDRVCMTEAEKTARAERLGLRNRPAPCGENRPESTIAPDAGVLSPTTPCPDVGANGAAVPTAQPNGEAVGVCGEQRQT